MCSVAKLMAAPGALGIAQGRLIPFAERRDLGALDILITLEAEFAAVKGSLRAAPGVVSAKRPAAKCTEHWGLHECHGENAPFIHGVPEKKRFFECRSGHGEGGTGDRLRSEEHTSELQS